MSSVSKFGIRLRSLGQKITGGVRNIGQKISSVALRLTPGLAAINPALGAAAAAVGGIAGVFQRSPELTSILSMVNLVFEMRSDQPSNKSRLSRVLIIREDRRSRQLSSGDAKIFILF
jgi:hypothetical protein